MRMTTISIALVLLMLAGIMPAFGAEGAGQHGSSASKVVRLDRAPVSKEILRVHLPRPVVTRLPNGLTLLVLEQHKLPTVAFSLRIESGAMTDPKDLPGLAMFTAEMLEEGTTHRSSSEFAADVGNIGSSFSTSAHFGSDTAQISASGLISNTDRILELMSDATLNPTFPEDELEKYKKRQLANLEQERSDPEFLAEERFRHAVYGDFPAAVHSATRDSVDKISRAQLQAFHDQYYVPSNAILGVVGDVKPEEVQQLVMKYFGEWKDHPVHKAKMDEVPPPSPFKISLVDRPGSVQTNILAGDYGARRVDADFIPMVVMNRVLGGGPQARLFLNLREDKSYTYGAYSYFGDEIYPDAWVAETEVRTAVTDGSMHELMYEFNRIRDQKIPEAELDDSRRAIAANFALSLEQPQRLLQYSMLVQAYGLPADYWDVYPEKLALVNQDVAQAAAKKFVDLAHLQVVCVGDRKQIENVLKKYGPVDIYDADGKRVE